MADEKSTVHYIDIDTTEADEALNQLQEHSMLISQETNILVRESYSSLVLLGDIMNIAIPAWFSMMFSAMMMAASAYREMATAELVASGGTAAWKAMLSYAASALLFMQGMALLTAGQQARGKLNSIISLLNLWS